MGILIKLAILPVLLGFVIADLPLDFDEPFSRLETKDDSETIYRLPEDLDPIHYDIEITPYFEATANREAFTFDGEVTLYVRTTKSGINSLIVQENVREILSVTLTNAWGMPMAINATNPFERLRQYHFLKVNLQDGVTLEYNRVYKLIITYLGNINETPLSRGVFRGSYKGSDGRLHWYAATHLQPTNSRQAFPSFDEPGFKSSFKIIINRPANFTETFSNMRIETSTQIGDRVKETFQTTPRMSAYLVTFHISEEFRVIADNNDVERSYRILARPNAQDQGAYALEVGPPLTRWLEDYLGIDYYTMAPYMKNDQIASPDWASGATENWGLVTYREVRLLYEEGETNALDKKYIGTITAHELAHKWFGNLVTCRWWDNVWINEGFASYFEYFAMDAVDPSMELEDQFNVFYLQSALSVDASASTRALQHTVNSPAQVTGHFTGISYSKGASLLLMLKHFLTENTFRKALNYFLVDRAYEHAFPSDLYRSFARAVAEDSVLDSSVNITEFMRYWVEERGYPVLNVELNRETGLINLSQERFFISATTEPTDQAWPLPLTYVTSNNPNWNNLRSSHVMTGKSYQIQERSGLEWVIFNVKQKGIYRVNYDVNTWNRLASVLKENYASIHHLNRAQIVDDVFALMRSERITFNLGFQVLEFLKEDTNFFVWYPAISGFTWLRNRFLHLPDTLAEFDAILLDYLDAVINNLGYNVRANEPLTTTLNRFFILTFACNIGHEGCVHDAVEKFAALRVNGFSVNPNLRRHVFCEGLRNGGYEEWRFLYQRRINSNNQGDQVAMLRSLGCTTNDRAIQEFLEMVLSDDVKAQDRVNALTFLYMGHRDSAKVALQFIKERVHEIRNAVVLTTWFQNVLSNLASYLDEEGLRDMEAWLRANQSAIPEFQSGLTAIASARASMQWGTERANMILRAARGSAFVALPTLMIKHVSDDSLRVISRDDRAFTFDGEVNIKFSTSANISQIKIHSEGLKFTSSNITLTTDNVIINLDPADALSFDEKYTFAIINLLDELKTGTEYNLNIVYEGPIRTDLNGFYRNYYYENGVKKWLGATQMEPTHARKVFPCFDEPALKAIFTLTIDRPANYQPTLTNTELKEMFERPNGIIREVFYPTPRMSTYLVAFLVSEFEAGNITKGPQEFGVFTRPEAKNQSAYAFDFGRRVVTALGAYFGIDYYSTNNNLRLDHIALPDFRAGAMENWGLIKYREALLLYVPEDSTPYYKYRVAQIVAHETTHMWFGNLVTCHWWSNTWLNEGFANYFQDYITALIEPDVGSADMLVIGSVYSAYEADQTPDSAPITNNNVNSPAEISGHFGTVTYQKAGSVIRMVHHLLGDNAFKYGLSSYLRANEFSVGYPEKMYTSLHEGVLTFNALSAYPETDITTVMSSWITQAGHPILSVHINYDENKITLTQKRFYVNSTSESDELYKIPITLTTGLSPNFENTKPSFIMHNKTETFDVQIRSTVRHWVIFNVQETGLYRVNYDVESWKLIAAALKGADREKIHHYNRAKIVNDLFAFLYADEVNFGLLHDVLEFLKEETDYSVWYAAIHGLNKLRTSYFGSDALEWIEDYALQLVDSIINKLGYEVRASDDFVTLRNRMQVLEFACKLRHQGCVDYTVNLFKKLEDNGTEISPSLRPVAYCSGLRYGNGDDYDFLWLRMSTTNVASEARIIADALGCTSDKSRLNSYLVSMQITDSPIRTQDLTVPLSSVLSNHSNVHIALEALQQNFTLWNEIYTTMDTVLATIATTLHSGDDFKKFEDWLSSCQQCTEQALNSAKGALAKARASAQWAEDHKEDVLKGLRSFGTSASASFVVIAIGLLITLCMN
ncbi:unnamed protein product, partial [Iphiclides podalirius]